MLLFLGYDLKKRIHTHRWADCLSFSYVFINDKFCLVTLLVQERRVFGQRDLLLLLLWIQNMNRKKNQRWWGRDANVEMNEVCWVRRKGVGLYYRKGAGR
jgi:hypothetical protein